MYTEQAIEEISTRIACDTYEKHETDIYQLHLCPISYSKQKMKEQMILRDLLEYCNSHTCSFCNLDYIKSLI